MTDEIKYMDLQEFMDEGFLQEANRHFFHPLGLALEVSASNRDSKYDTLRVWDYREDPEGVMFGEGVIDHQKIHKVNLERFRHMSARVSLLGRVVQHEVPPLKPT